MDHSIIVGGLLTKGVITQGTTLLLGRALLSVPLTIYIFTIISSPLHHIHIVSHPQLNLLSAHFIHNIHTIPSAPYSFCTLFDIFFPYPNLLFFLPCTNFYHFSCVVLSMSGLGRHVQQWYINERHTAIGID